MDLIADFMLREFRVDIKGAFSFYDIYTCSTASSSLKHTILLLIFQIMFQQGAFTLYREFPKIATFDQNTQQMRFNNRINEELLQQDLDNSFKFYKSFSHIFMQKCRPVSLYLQNSQIQDIFQLFTPEEQRMIIVKQQKRLQGSHFDYLGNQLTEDIEIKAEWSSSDEEDDQEEPKEYNPDNFRADKDPFVNAVKFLKKLKAQDLLLRWLNFIYSSYQFQECQVQLENNLRVRLEEKHNDFNDKASSKKAKMMKSFSDMQQALQKEGSTPNVPAEGAKKRESRAEVRKRDSSMFEEVSSSQILEVTGDQSKQAIQPIPLDPLDPNEKIFATMQFKQISRIEDLVDNGFEILIKIISFMAPEMLFQVMDVENMTLKQLNKISAGFFNQSIDDSDSEDDASNLFGAPKPGLQNHSQIKLVVLCNHFIKVEKQHVKNLFIINSGFKITSRMDLIKLDALMKIELNNAEVRKDKKAAYNLAPLDELAMKKMLATLFLSRPLMNSHHGIKTVGVNGTIFMEQVSIVRKFYEDHRTILNTFDKEKYDKLNEYIQHAMTDKRKVESALMYVNVCDRVYKDCIAQKLVQVSMKDDPHPLASLQISTSMDQLITSSNVDVLDKIDHEISLINFLHVSQILKAGNFSQTWVNKILFTLQETFNIPLKQFFINKLQVMCKSPINQRQMQGYMSYIQVENLLATLNFETFKFRTDEIEFIIFQFIHLKLHEFKKNLPKVVSEKMQSTEKDDDSAFFNKPKVTDEEFMRKMREKLEKVRPFSNDLLLNNADQGDEKTSGLQALAKMGTTYEEPDQLDGHVSQKLKQANSLMMAQAQLRQNVYNWKYSIQDIFELLLIMLFNNQNNRRTQIIEELVKLKNPEFFATILQNQVQSVVL